ncbi:hypothetical protein [Bacillus sp. Hm123]|uniref:hypothetical protein n=1 Tax=Bacillus sp. Hm123 TaxID=3450745 RepID=UPI003F42AB7A
MEALIRDEKKIMINGEEIKVKSLGLQHLFTFIKILKKAGIVNYFSKLVGDLQNQEGKTEEEKRGDLLGIVFNLVFSLIESESEIYALVASLIGKEEKDVKELPLDSFVEIVEMIATSKDLKSFFKAVQKMLGKQEPAAQEVAAPIANPIQ